MAAESVHVRLISAAGIGTDAKLLSKCRCCVHMVVGHRSHSFDEKVKHAQATGPGFVMQSSVKRKGLRSVPWDERFVLRVPPRAAISPPPTSASDTDGDGDGGEGAGSNLEVHLRLSDGTKATLRSPHRTGRAQCMRA